MNCFSHNEAGLSHQNGLVLAAAGRGAPPLRTHRGSCKVPTSDLARTAAGRGKRVLTFSVLPITAAEPSYAHKRAARLHLVRRACRHTQHSSALRWRGRCPLPAAGRAEPLSPRQPPVALFSSRELQLRLFPHGRRQSHGSAPPAISQPKPLFPPPPHPSAPLPGPARSRHLPRGPAGPRRCAPGAPDQGLISLARKADRRLEGADPPPAQGPPGPARPLLLPPAPR